MPKWTREKKQQKIEYVEYDLPDSVELGLVRVWNVRLARHEKAHARRRYGR